MKGRLLRGVGRCRFLGLRERLTFARREKRKPNAETQKALRFAEKIGEVAHCFVARAANNGCPAVRSFAAPPGLRDLIMGCDTALACWAKFFGRPPGLRWVVILAPDMRAWRHWGQH